MKTTTLLCFFFAIGALKAQSLSWVNQIGGTDDPDYGLSVTTDADGNVYTTGSFESIVDFDSSPAEFLLTSTGKADMFISKYNPAGQLVWAIRIGDDGPDGLARGWAIAVGPSGSVYVTGHFSGMTDFDPGANEEILVTVPYWQGCIPDNNLFILKLTGDGEFIWVREIGAPDGMDEGSTIALGPNEEVHVAGQVASNSNALVDFDPGIGIYELPGSAVTFLLKLDSDGLFMWVDQFNGACVQAFGCGYRDNLTYIYDLTADGAGQIFITGSFNCTTDFDPGIGTLILNGSGTESFVVKLSPSGGLIWARRFSGDSNSAHGITVDGNGNVYTTGGFSKTVDFDPSGIIKNLKSVAGTPDVFVSKLNALGNYVWAVAMGGSGNDWGAAIDLDGSGNVYTAGRFTGTGDYNPGQQKFNLKSAGDLDIFVSKLNSSAGFMWAGRMGGEGKETCNSLNVDGSNNVLLTGEFELTADFDPATGTQTLTSLGGRDGYVLRLNQSAGLLPSDPEIVTRSITTEMQIYPNPARENVLVSFNAGNESEYEIFLTDMTGRIVRKQTGTNYPGPNEYDFFFGNIPSGLYQIHFVTGDIRKVKRIVIE